MVGRGQDSRGKQRSEGEIMIEKGLHNNVERPDLLLLLLIACRYGRSITAECVESSRGEDSALKALVAMCERRIRHKLEDPGSDLNTVYDVPLLSMEIHRSSSGRCVR